MSDLRPDTTPVEEVISKIREGVKPFIRQVESTDSKGCVLSADDFTALYNIVFFAGKSSDDKAKRVYDAYEEMYVIHLQEVLPALVEVQSDTLLLREWVSRFEKHKLMVKGLNKVVSYLSGFFIPRAKLLNPVHVGFKAFQDIIFTAVHPAVRRALLAAIGREREGEPQDRHMLAQSVQVFIDLGFEVEKKTELYETAVHLELVEETIKFYRKKSEQLVSSCSTPEYLIAAEECFRQERSRDAYLHASSMDPLEQVVYNELIGRRLKELLEKDTGINYLLESCRLPDLSRLYQMCIKHPEDLNIIAEYFHKWLLGAGAAVTKGDQSDGMVNQLIELHEKYLHVVKACFGGSVAFLGALKQGMQNITRLPSLDKLLAKHSSNVLNKNSKVGRDTEKLLDSIAALYGYMPQKDTFELEYQLALAQRLLLGQSESEHAEKAMIAKLKAEAGYQWTNKLEGMFKDVQLSNERMEKFKKYMSSDSYKPEFDLEVKVCTSAYWPDVKKGGGKVPEAAQEVCNYFKNFYLAQNSGHRLDWKLNQGEAEVIVQFPASKYNLACSTYQMMVLLAFNGRDTLKYSDMLEITGVPFDDLGDHVLSLAHPKVAVLQKKPNTREIKEDDAFRLNPQFKSPTRRVQIPLMRAMPQKGTDLVDETIALQRMHLTDATVVRLMKSRRTMGHNQLMAEVLAALKPRFEATPDKIRKRIEYLMENQYMERDADDRSKYNYLA